ncbi:L,D-transpeptidase family protein [Acidithiobacillus ferridurans]|uniref:YkuD domain-containing protein n=1 Tax=Acidithiobacillus ferridurans TaxID=1232575 RepID=A0A8X8G8J7_ACIFI|nr:L,D-transpeptidase family protein [Acidithiobacillus ferridurans]MBU2715823.1 hypothetical protein [Acidithiobacillus ferridurans]MBU2722820.1 hypothetical protein [Acidithiobacillus ferridurans]MBU2727793.1 hypothetical protein [Acidithiobacillus ferridurans]
MTRRIASTLRVLSVSVLAVALAGCLSTDHAIRHQPLAAAAQSATKTTGALTPPLHVLQGPAALQGTHQGRTAFSRYFNKYCSGDLRNNRGCFHYAVARLETLGYLPVKHSFIHNNHGNVLRHDAFRFAVPEPLQHTADQYAWSWNNPFIRGAMIQFERETGVLGQKGVSYGRPHRAVVAALFSRNAQPDTVPWEWVFVDKHRGTPMPETLKVWNAVAQHYVGRTLINTGVLGSTPNGTWPIYQRLPSTTMRGVFPVPVSAQEYAALSGQVVQQWAGSTLLQPARGMVNGHPVRWQPYKDPGIRWVNYFDDGRGIHYYPRARYGFPQSAGCVEEPLKQSAIVYKLLHYGVPVTVEKLAYRKAGMTHPADLELSTSIHMGRCGLYYSREGGASC